MHRGLSPGLKPGCYNEDMPPACGLPYLWLRR